MLSARNENVPIYEQRPDMKCRYVERHVADLVHALTIYQAVLRGSLRLIILINGDIVHGWSCAQLLLKCIAVKHSMC